MGSQISFSFKTLSIVISMLDKVFKSNLRVEGLEHLVENPTLYVVNHFTRSETLLLPYVIHKHRKHMVHSLADSGLFHGRLGDHLRDLGAISTREPFRNRKIIQELMTGAHDWVIFPEGLMVKNKAIYHRGKLRLDNPERQGPPHTGAAVLALKAEMAKRQYLTAIKKGDHKTARRYEERYNFHGPDALSFKDVVIVPVNITYYPVRPDQNIFISLARMVSKEISKRAEEELKVEGNLLLSKTDIDIHFGRPINLYQYLDNVLPMVNTLFPFLHESTRSDMILGIQKHRLTNRFMREIYHKVAVNIDHVVASIIRYSNSKKLDEDELKALIYLLGKEFDYMESVRVHPSLGPALQQLVTDHLYKPFEDILDLAVEQGTIRRQDGFVHINDPRGTLPFHRVRLKGLITVFANEIEPLKNVVQRLQEVSRWSRKKKQKAVADHLIQEDLDAYQKEFEALDPKESTLQKKKGAEAFFLDHPKAEWGVVLCHGYLASPLEMRASADHLYEQGFSVYGVRLQGHGTRADALKGVSLEGWRDAFDRAYGVIKHRCKHVVVGGFSTGGLMALLAAANKQNHVRGVFTINAALQLRDLRSKLVPTVAMWNDLLESWNIQYGKMEYIENQSENPDVNYERNYLHGVKTLGKLIKRTHQRLSHVVAPTLVIQGDADPVVLPESGQAIIDGIQSDHRELKMLPYDRHIIVKEGDITVFNEITRFLHGLRKATIAVRFALP